MNTLATVGRVRACVCKFMWAFARSQGGGGKEITASLPLPPSVWCNLLQIFLSNYLSGKSTVGKLSCCRLFLTLKKLPILHQKKLFQMRLLRHKKWTMNYIGWDRWRDVLMIFQLVTQAPNFLGLRPENVCIIVDKLYIHTDITDIKYQFVLQSCHCCNKVMI